MNEGVSEFIERWVDLAPTGRALDLGAGCGDTARWLASRGFTVDAVERDASRYSHLVEDSPDPRVKPRHVDLLRFPLVSRRYTLIVASAVLHFLLPTELWPLADRLSDSLAIGGLLLAEVFTTDDPGFAARTQSGAIQLQPNTFNLEDGTVMHYFEQGELRRLFSRLQLLEYEESRELDRSSAEGYSAGASLAARRTG